MADIDAIESQGMDAVLALAQRVALDAQAEGPSCDEGSRNGAARSQLAVRFVPIFVYSPLFFGVVCCHNIDFD